MNLDYLGLAVLVGATLLLCASGTISVAARSLTRLQRLAWAADRRVESGEEENADPVEDALVSLGLARQCLLVVIVMQVASMTLARGWSPAAGVGIAMLLFLFADRLIPTWIVSLVGPSPALRVNAPVLAVERALFGWLTAYLRRNAEHARRRNRTDNGAPEPGDLGVFLDIAGEEGLVTESEEALLRGVADFGDAVVREVMTPRVDIVAIEASGSLDALRDLIAEYRFSRIPVVNGGVDDVVGVVNLKDLLTLLGEGSGDQPLRSIVRPVRFVPETKKVSELLTEFQRRRDQLCIVVDEHGGTAGLVTLEDVLEEIVGEIQDEDEESLIEYRGDRVYASGKAEIEDVGDAVGVTIEEGEYHTVGGLVFTQLGRVPLRGESFEHSGLRFDIVEADERRVNRVRVRRIEPVEAGG